MGKNAGYPRNIWGTPFSENTSNDNLIFTKTALVG